MRGMNECSGAAAAGESRMGWAPRERGHGPAVLTELDLGARIMNEEPFGPMVPNLPFADADAALAAANGTPYGLAAFVFTNSLETEHTFSRGLAAGAVAVNHFAVVAAEVPFGGIGDSGFGSEGGREGIRNYVTSKYVTVSPGTL